MLNRTVKEKMLKIMELGFEVNRKEKNTVFIRFSGHCELFEVSIHSKGWKNGVGADFFKDIFFSSSPENETRKSLDEIIEELERLKIN